MTQRKRTFSQRREARLVNYYRCEPVEPRVLLSSWTTFTVPSNIGSISNMMLLSDGTVMAHGADNGGESSIWSRLTPGQPGNVPGVDQSYINGSWQQLPSMAFQRQFFPSAVLPNGNVFVLGGENASDQNFSNSAEIYNTLTNSWIPGIRPYAQDASGNNLAPVTSISSSGSIDFGDDPIEVLPDGRVLAGNINSNKTFIYNPATNAWSAGPDKVQSDDISDEETWVKLPDGSILTYDCRSQVNQNKFLAERYIPSLTGGIGQWIDASNLDPNNKPTLLTVSNLELGGAVLLPNGNVFITGNAYPVITSGITALFNTHTNTWSAGPTIPKSVGGGDLPMAVMPNGHVLVAEYGSEFNAPGSDHIWEYDPNNAAQPYTERKPPAPFVDANYPYMLMLPTGQVLVSDMSNTLFVYTPDGGPADSQRPYIANVTSIGVNIFEVTGTQLTGISEGASYGDDAEMASNYPIVRLVNSAGTVAYARSFDWSSTGVAQGNTPQSFRFSLPIGWDPDAYLLTVSANGISSGQVLNVQLGAATTTNVALQPYNFNPAFVEVLANGSIESVWALSSFASVMVSGNNADELIVINQDFGGRFVTVNGSGGNDIIRVEANGGSTLVNGDDGNDITDFSFAANNLSNITGATTVNGGAGDDSIFVYDNANSASSSYGVNSIGMSRSGWGGLAYGTGVEHASLTTGTANNPVSVTSTNANQNIFLYSASGADAVTVGGNGTAQSILGNVEIHNAPNFSSLTVDDTNDFGSRNIVIDSSGSLGVLTGITGSIGGAISWANSDISSLTVTTSQFGSGTVSVRAMSVPFTLHCLTVGNQGANYAVSLGNNTNGMQSILSTVTLRAAFGQNQSLTLNDSGDTSGRNVVLTRSSLNGNYSVNGLMLGTLTIQDFGSIIVQEGSGADAFTADETNQGGYDDDLPLTVQGNGGNDTFSLTGYNNWAEGLGGTFTFPVMFDGGTGFNSLSINDAARGNTSYQFYADRFYSRDSTAFAVGSDFNYDNMSAIGLSCSNGSNSLAIYSTSSDIPAGSQISIALSGGNDTATMYPHDAQGNLTINGTIGIGAGTGTDAMIFDDTEGTSGINYSFSNPFGAGTQDVFGIGAAGMGYTTSDFESATFNAGSGNDSFTLNQYQGSTPLAINGNDGNDSFEVTPASKNMGSNLYTGNNSFTFNGGAGSDSIGLHNDNNATGVADNYVVDGTLLRALSGIGSPSFALFIQHSSVEHTSVTGGPKADSFGIFNTAANTVYNFDGGPGAVSDAFYLGMPLSPQTVSGIHGGVYVDGSGGGADTLTIYNNTETAGRTFHIGNEYIGATPGDDLFGAGGYLHYAGITGVTNINLGSGADTVLALPSPSTPISITGGSPTTTPGDTLILALAAAQNYVLHGTASSGSVTSGNLKTLSYSGFENNVAAALDAVAPSLAAPALAAPPLGAPPLNTDPIFHYETAPNTLTATFSENVSELLGASSLSLTNITTGDGFASQLVGYEVGSNNVIFAFPGASENGVLPDGNYSGAFLASGVLDIPGNAMAADYPFAFFVLCADANHDRTVDTLDFTSLAAHFNQIGATFSQGDFNYDGKVNALDFNVLASKFGTHLLPSASAPILNPEMDSAASASNPASPLATLFSANAIKSAVTSDVLDGVVN